MWVRSWRELGGLLVLSSGLTGCTLLGAGVGAGVDSMVPGPYESRPAEQCALLERGDRVVVNLPSSRIEGRYVGRHGPTLRDPELYLLIESSDGIASVPASEVKSIGVEVTGKGWLYGGIAGAAVDVAVVIAVISFANMQYRGEYWKNDCCY